MLEPISKGWADKLQSHCEAVFGAKQDAWFLHVPQFRRKKRAKWGSRLPFTTFEIGSLGRQPLLMSALLAVVIATVPASIAGTVATVTELDIEYTPEDQVVHVGDPIRLTNQDPFEHKSRVTAITAGGTPGEIVLHDHLEKPGESFTFHLNNPGTYEVRCMIHDGMTATIKVVQ